MPRADELPLRDQVRLLSGASHWHTRALPGVRAVKLADGPHGLRVQPDAEDHLGLGASEPATCFPPAVTLASTWDEELATAYGAALGAEAAAQGVDVVLGPGLNLKRHPLGGRNFEYFSEDPLVSGRMAAAVVTGLQSQGVGACVKHFAVNNQEGHRFVVDAILDERTLRELYLSSFEHVIRQARPWAVMSSYNRVLGTPASENRRLLTEILRGEWAYDGLVMSDWGGTRDRVAAVAAGMDLEMPGSHGLFDAEVIAAVERGSLAGREVTASAQRVLDLAGRVQPRDVTADYDAHHDFAARVAAAGTVLLTNDGVLPLAPGERLAVVGAFADRPRFQGGGSSKVEPTRVSSLLSALRSRGIDPAYAPGYDPAHSAPNRALIEAAVEVARDAEVVVVHVGLPARFESEGWDRDTLALPTQHDELVEAICAVHDRVVVVLTNGSPVVLPWRDRPAAIVESYLGGQAGGEGLARVLLGEAEPGGRLTESFPASLDMVASDPWFPGAARQVQHREGLFVGYRHDVSAGVEPAYAFGHGLSYTTFEWDECALSAEEVEAGAGVTVQVGVTNTGTRAGSDVVQVYRADRSGVVQRPERELAGWAKVHLEPGESRVVSVAVDARAIAFWDVRIDGWSTPSGAYELLIARSSASVVASLPLSVVGGVEDSADPPRSELLAASDEEFVRLLGHRIPAPESVRPFTRDSTMEELAETRVGRLLFKAITKMAPVEEDPLDQEMVERSLRELPLRSVAIFSAGKFRLPTVDLIVAAANGDGRRAARVVARVLRRLAISGVERTLVRSAPGEPGA
jgi:beta-glucosidase